MSFFNQSVSLLTFPSMQWAPRRTDIETVSADFYSDVTTKVAPQPQRPSSNAGSGDHAKVATVISHEYTAPDANRSEVDSSPASFHTALSHVSSSPASSQISSIGGSEHSPIDFTSKQVGLWTLLSNAPTETLSKKVRIFTC